MEPIADGPDVAGKKHVLEVLEAERRQARRELFEAWRHRDRAREIHDLTTFRLFACVRGLNYLDTELRDLGEVVP